MFPNSAFHKKLLERVNDLLVQANVTSAPVPVRKIAEMCNAKVLGYDLGKEVSGVLVFENNIGTIGYNISNVKTRQRFTIAHELGHLILHVDKYNNSKELFVDKDFIVKFRSDKPYSNKDIKQEREANAFAAALLMPRDFIMKEIRDLKYKDFDENRLISAMAKLFDVSIPAMTYRFAELNMS